MSDPGRVTWLARPTRWAVRHPAAVLAITCLLLGVSIVSLRRTTVSGSLQAMIGSDAPAITALARITEQYRRSDELLILATLPMTQSPDRAGKKVLLDFARRLESAAKMDSVGASLCKGFQYQSDPVLQAYIQQIMLPAGAFYLSDAGFDELLLRLKPEQMKLQLARNEAMISAPGPAADAISKLVLRDPLRLFELIDGSVAASAGARPSPSGEPDGAFSDDGRSLLIRITGVRPVNDLPFARRFTAEMTRLIAETNIDHLAIEVGGSYAIADRISRSIRSDAISSTLSSVLLVMVCLILFNRRLSAPLLIGGVVAAGVVIAFGAHTALSSSITPLSATAAAMLAGLGVDYGIHFLAHYQESRSLGLSSEQASTTTAEQLGLGLLGACLTTIMGFIAVWPAKTAMLRDFAELGSLGLLGALLAVVTVMPAILTLIDRRTPAALPRPRESVIADFIVRSSRLWLVASGLVLVGAIAVIATAGLPALEDDLAVMHPQPSAPLEATEHIQAKFADMGESVPIEICASTPDSAVSAAHDVARALVNARNPEVEVTGVIGLCSLLPDPRVVASRRARLDQLNPDAVIATFDDALQGSIFNPAAYDAYRIFLRTLIAPGAAPAPETLMGFPTLAEQVYPARAVDSGSPASETVLLAHLAHPMRGRTARDSAIDGLHRMLQTHPEATLTGSDVVSHELEQGVREQLPRSFGIALGLIVLWLAIAFRRAMDVLLSLVPVAFSCICMLACMSIAHVKLNPVNAVAIPLLAGMAVDSGIFLVAAARNGVTGLEGCVTMALLACAATTILGFGTLYWTHTPAIQSLGIACAIGVLAGAWGSLLLLLPLLVVLGRKRDDVEAHTMPEHTS